MYLKGSKGALRFWAIESASDGYYVEWGQVGSLNVQEEHTPIPYGKGTRSQLQQIEAQVAARIKKRLESGYCLNPEDALKKDGKGLNDLGLPRAMLAAPFKNIKVSVSEYFHQPKLDGHRCMASISDGSAQMYSRNAKPITAPLEIIEELHNINIDIVLDGELYSHGIPLQTIGSWVKRRQELTSELEYWVYDCVVPDECFADRYERLTRIFDNTKGLSRIRLCPTTKGVSDATASLQSYRNNGYEGAILRDPRGQYEPGKRSKGLVKVKSWEDDEFRVIGVTASRDGWGILHCKAENKKIFTVSAPGNWAEKKHVLDHIEDYIGRDVRVEYANLTNDGIPFHPIATMWRKKDDE